MPRTPGEVVSITAREQGRDHATKGLKGGKGVGSDACWGPRSGNWVGNEDEVYEAKV